MPTLRAKIEPPLRERTRRRACVKSAEHLPRHFQILDGGAPFIATAGSHGVGVRTADRAERDPFSVNGKLDGVFCQSLERVGPDFGDGP